MDAILKLPIELQIVAVSGYLALMITTIGRGPSLKPEHTFLRVLVFGSVARLLTVLLAPVASWLAAAAGVEVAFERWLDESDRRVFATGGATLLVAVLTGILWRRIGLPPENWSSL